MAKPTTFTECNAASVRDAAEYYASNGLQPVKISLREKKPIEKAWQLLDYGTGEKAVATFATHTGNIGIRGDESGLIGIDFDDERFKDAMLRELPMLTNTLQSMGRKPTGHCWVRLTKPLKNESIRLHFEDRTKQTFADLRGIGGQIVVAPSIHPDGDHYKWLNNNPILPLDTDVFLTALDKACSAVGAKNPYRKATPTLAQRPPEENTFSIIKAGVGIQRYLNTNAERVDCPVHKETTPSQAMRLYPTTNSCYCFSCGFAGDVISLHAKINNLSQFEAAKELAKKFDVKLPATWKNPLLPKDCTTPGAAQPNNNKIPDNDNALIDEISTYVEDCRRHKAAPDGMKIVSWLAHYLADKNSFITFEDTQEILIYSEADGIYKNGGAAFIRKRIQEVMDKGELPKYSSTHHNNETLDMIRRLTMVNRKDADEPENLSCLANGVFDVDSGVLNPFSPKYKFFSKLAVFYDASATCPETDKFVACVMPPENAGLFFELAGACIQRDNPWQKGFVFYSDSGTNGKSTMINLLKYFLGESNVTSVGLQELEENRFAIAGLYQKHANLVPDMSAADLKSTGRFKAALGGDLLRAEHKNGQPFFFVNYAKFIVSCNKLPKTPDDSKAFYRRWVILQFPNCFEGREDRGLLSRICTPGEMSGLLNKAIIAIKKVRETGRFSYDLNSDAIRSLYVHLSDSATAFCEDMLCSSDLEQGIAKEDIWHNYLKFCKDRRLVRVTEKCFWQTLPEIYDIFTFKPSKEFDPDRKRRVMGIVWKANRGQEVQQGQHSSIMAPALEKGVQKSEKGGVGGEIGKMLPFPPLLDKKHPRATITTPQGAGSPAFSNLKEVVAGRVAIQTELGVCFCHPEDLETRLAELKAAGRRIIKHSPEEENEAY